MLAQELPLAGAALQQVAHLGEDGLLVDGVLAVGPEVVEEHWDQRDDEEGRVDVGDEIGL